MISEQERPYAKEDTEEPLADGRQQRTAEVQNNNENESRDHLHVILDTGPSLLICFFLRTIFERRVVTSLGDRVL